MHGTGRHFATTNVPLGYHMTYPVLISSASQEEVRQDRVKAPAARIIDSLVVISCTAPTDRHPAYPFEFVV